MKRKNSLLGLRTMDLQLQFIISILLVSVYVFFNAQLTKEILIWEPSLAKRTALVLAVWLIPVLGVVVAYKYLDLDWFKKRSKKSNGAQNALSGALLEVDAVFNPGQRHVIEARKKEHVELSEDGQLYKNDPINVDNMQKSQASESSENT